MTDRRYGVNQYGDGKLYGASTDLDFLAWDISFDWDNDGIFESNENANLLGFSMERGRHSMLKSSGNGFQEVPTGRARIVLNNSEGRFDAWNTASPIYPNVNYGVQVRVRVRDMESGTMYSRMRGVVTNISPSGYGHNRAVTFTISDGLHHLRNAYARVTMQQNITVTDALALALSSAKYPWGSNLDVTAETIDYWWASGNKLASSTLNELAESFLGYFFIDADNVARYIARASVPTLSTSIDESECLKDIDNPQPYDIYRNICRLKVHPRTAAASSAIWQLVGAPSVLAGDSLTIFADYTYINQKVPALNATMSSSDYTMNTQSDGGGSNLTSQFSVTLTDFGDTAKIVFRNNSASLGYITFAQIIGDAIYEPNAADVTYPTDISTVAKPRELTIDLIWQQDFNIAVDIATVQGAFFTSLHPMPAVKMQALPSKQFIPDLFDVVEVSLPSLNLSGETYRVAGIDEATLNSNCQSVLTTLYLEPYIAAGDFMQWDTNAEWDSTTVFGW